MRSIFNLLEFILSLLVFLFLAQKASAQSVGQYVREMPAPKWVLSQSLPQAETSLTPEGSQFYRLVDWQQRISATADDKYRHYAIELRTAEAVEDYSNFTISFDPSFQKVHLHKLELVRDGNRLNRLDLSKFDIYRTETDRDKLIYDGRLEASIIIPDVQVGDILDYSFTVIGKNKAFGPHYKTTTGLQYSTPVQRQHERILIHKDLPVNIMTHGNPPEPVKGKDGNYRSFKWAQNDLKDMDVESNLPAWYYSQPTYELSSFETWEEVGEYFADKYIFDHQAGGAISDIAMAIKSESDSVKTRTRLALNYIHEKIRYTGMEIGSGGYIPRPPDQTLSQKFGDCKDMTVLLLAILREMNVEAHPILVNTSYRKGIEGVVPSYAAFNHVLVRAEIEGKIFLLDGTRGEQLGDLDRIEQSSYGKALLLAPGAARLIDLDHKQPEYYKDVQDTFDFISDPGNVKFESVTNYYGYEADNMNSQLLNDGAQHIEKGFFEFFQDTYPDIEQIGNLEITAFREESKFVVKANYSLGKGWVDYPEEDYKGFEAYPTDVSNDTPEFKGGTRKMPYVLSHPRKSRHTLIFKLDETWTLDEADVKIENEAFSFRKISTFKNGVYKESHSYQSKQDYIPAASFSKIMDDVKKLDDELGVELTSATDWLSNVSEETLTNIFLIWFYAAGIISLIGVMLVNKTSAAGQEGQIFYPLKLSKFILLSAISMGVYCYYWAYKNWQWLRDAKGVSNIPFLRSLFMALTNLSLLPQLAQEEGQKKGYLWYARATGVVLAVLYFGLALTGRVAGRTDDAPLWLSWFGILSFIALIPAAMQINRLNEGREDIIAKNSQYHWTTIVFILLFSPVYALVLYGMLS